MRRLRLLLTSLALAACADGTADLPVETAGPAQPGDAGQQVPPPDAAASPFEELPLPPSGKHLGATPIAGGVELRVWAPNAATVAVVGEVAGATGRQLVSEGGGFFAARVLGAKPGQKYRYEIVTTAGQKLLRVDPRARQLEGAESVVVDPRSYVWKTKPFEPAPREATVIYELHVSSFYAPSGVGTGTFVTAAEKLDALADLGVNAIELMPANAHGTSHGWGYNPRAFSAPHPSYGTPDQLRALVDAAHERGIAVLLDVVYNHYDRGTDAPLYCFDGCPAGGAGVYFFDADPYRMTPWGPRANFAKQEVSDLFADDVFGWMTEYRIDGFRFDSVSNIRALDGTGAVPGGVELLQRLTAVATKIQPRALLVAEDLKGFAPITAPSASGGLGFAAQWEGSFHGAVTGAATAATDAERNLVAVRDALSGSYNGDPFQRLLYVESHDTAGNSGARLPMRIDAASPASLGARRRAMLAAGVLLTAPGVPMLFMGQEMLEPAMFTASPAPLDWTNATTFAPVRTFHRDLVRLRRNADGVSSGLLGKNVAVTHLNDGGGNKVIIYRRWGVPGDDVMVVANFGAQRYARYDLGLPGAGPWVARVDGDHVRYGADLGSAQPTTVTMTTQTRDGLPYMGTIALGPYSIVVLTR